MAERGVDACTAEQPPSGFSQAGLPDESWQRFIEECRSALPMAVSDNGAVTLESVFEGVTFQQMVLKLDQQLTEWQPNPLRR